MNDKIAEIVSWRTTDEKRIYHSARVQIVSSFEGRSMEIAITACGRAMTMFHDVTNTSEFYTSGKRYMRHCPHCFPRTGIKRLNGDEIK